MLADIQNSTGHGPEQTSSTFPCISRKEGRVVPGEQKSQFTIFHYFTVTREIHK